MRLIEEGTRRVNSTLHAEACATWRLRTFTVGIISLSLAAAMAAAAPNGKVFPYAYDQHDFANGLRLITVPTDYPNVVALQIVVATGSRNEVEPGKTGFAHFFEHMMFRGTKQVSSEKFTAAMQEAGAQFNASTHDDYTNYHETFSKPDLETMLRLEADRFQNLDYSLADFRTEALAVLGEYNKSISNPLMKMNEALSGMAFRTHTYRHTTIGFLEDIQDMPNQYAYSKEFFNRYYRPEYTTIIVVGDAVPSNVKAIVERYWGRWRRGGYKAPIPVEPAQDGPRVTHIDWSSPTLPILEIAYRVPAYHDSDLEIAALDIIQSVGFSSNSPLYKTLVISGQKADMLGARNSSQVDPSLFDIVARVKKKEDLAYVQEQILSTLAGFKDTLVSEEQLARASRRARYSFAMGLDNSEAIARTVAAYVALARTPETINRLYDTYAKVTPEDIRNAARKYFLENNRNVVTLTWGGK